MKAGRTAVMVLAVGAVVYHGASAFLGDAEVWSQNLANLKREPSLLNLARFVLASGVSIVEF
jgi:hypothetical protein